VAAVVLVCLALLGVAARHLPGLEQLHFREVTAARLIVLAAAVEPRVRTVMVPKAVK
jgi:hypothetical protein